MKIKTLDIVYIAVGAVLLTVCSWISIPSAVPFTLQTFAVFFIVCFLGGKKGLISIVIYILLGIAGIPVFSGFQGGVPRIIGPTGGYIIGFIFIAVLYWIFQKKAERSMAFKVIILSLGLILCYAFGTAWFVVVYTGQAGPVGFLSALSMCVFPFIIPDAAKLSLAVFVSHKLKKLLHM